MPNTKSLIALALLVPSLLSMTALEASANSKKDDKKPSAPAAPVAPAAPMTPTGNSVNSSAPASNPVSSNASNNGNSNNGNGNSSANSPVVPVAPVITSGNPSAQTGSSANSSTSSSTNSSANRAETPVAPVTTSTNPTNSANTTGKPDEKKSDAPPAPVINLTGPPVVEPSSNASSNGNNNGKKADAPPIDFVSPIVISSTSPTAPTSTCQNGSVTAGLLSFTSCISGSGNDVQSGKPGEILTSQLATGVFGGIKNWSLLSKVNAGETSSAFNWSGGNKGSWSVTTPLNRPFVLSLKAGTAWSAYYFANASAITQGTWDTLGVVGQKAGQGLSHASIFVAPDDNPPKPVEVPEPTGLGALGLAGVFGLRKLRKRALRSEA